MKSRKVVKPEQIESDEITFELFFMVWADIMQWDVPEFHWEVIRFLSDYKNWKEAGAVLSIFRGAGKSTILGLYIVWLLVKDPTLRFLVLSADSITAQRITQDCLSIIVRHPLAVHLKGKEQTWMKHRFSVRGSTDARNPSVAAHGIMSNITSARADFVIFDDVEVPKNCANEPLREQLRRRINETTHILVPRTGRKLFVGTPHAYESIYPEMIYKGFSALQLPLIMNPQGEYPELFGDSRWPERFDDHTIAQRQREITKGEFLSQYMLLPYNVEDALLDPTLLQEYDEEIEFKYANKTMSAHLDGKRLMSVSAFWDVAISKARGDDSVLGIVFTAEDGHIYIHRTINLIGDINNQCKQVADAAYELNIPLVIVETNGPGVFVPQILLEHTRGKGIGVDGRATTKNKGLKILESFEAPLSGGFLHIHKSVANSKFPQQLRDFRPNNQNIHDDFIDAAASAIDNEPIRIGRGGFDATGNKVGRWQALGETHDIEVEMATI